MPLESGFTAEGQKVYKIYMASPQIYKCMNEKENGKIIYIGFEKLIHFSGGACISGLAWTPYTDCVIVTC